MFKVLVKTLSWNDPKEVKSLIFTCRLVCHSWNKSIETLSEEIWNPDWNIKETGSPKPIKELEVGKVVKKCYSFASIQQIDQFLFKFGSCYHDNINPFPGRGVSIVFTSTQLADQIAPIFYHLLALFLDTFGRFILHCEFMLHLNTDKSNVAYVKLLEFLESLPKLKTLIIHNLNPSPCSPTLKRLSLNLRHLQSLKFVYVSSTVCNAIIRDNWQIKKLYIAKPSFDIYTDINLHGGFENLEQLVLRGCNWKEIQKLSTSNLLNDWPVKKFHLELDTNSFQWFDLFEVLSKSFNETLEELVLFLPEITNKADMKQILKGSRDTRLVMPNMKKFSMELENECSFDFLLGMNESLEWLRINAGKWRTTKFSEESEEVKRKQILKIWGYQDKLYESNIWKYFPKLKAVELDCWKKGIPAWWYS